MTPRQIVEFFHLVFLRALFAGLKDKTLLSIKGGINMRFFFQSVRFSEDLDVDVMTMSKETLENRVDRLLESPAVVSPLKARAVVIRDVGKPKQTQTVQKWKLGVAVGAVNERTKIEFSRRDDVRNAAFESVDPQIAAAHALPPFLVTHYRVGDAVRQKVHALMDRSETQPRDVFDLDILFARPDAPSELDDEAKEWAEPAAENASSLSYDEYVSLVVAYLDPEHAPIYASRAAWEAMQTRVVERILALT